MLGEIAVKRQLRLIISVVAVLVGLVITFVWSFAGMAEAPFHPDESRNIYMARYFDLFFIKRDFLNAEWDITSYWALNHLPLSKYLTGFALFITRHDFSALCGPWDWNLDKEMNLQLGNVPSATALLASRALMTALFALSIVLCAIAAYQVGGWPAALVAGLLFLMNDLASRTLRRATPDAPLLFFSLATVLSDMKVIDHLSSSASNACRRTYIWGTLTGLGLGLATASKLSAISLIPMVLLSPGVPLCLRRFRAAPSPPECRPARVLMTILAVTIVVFAVLNPTLYRNPLVGTAAFIGHRLGEANDQQSALPQGALITVPARVRATVNHIFTPMSLVVFLLGLSLLVWQEFDQWRNQRATRRTPLFLWVTGTFGFTVLFTPMNWDRYFAPLIPCKAVIVGYLASGVLATLLRGLRQSSPVGPWERA